MLFDWCWTFRHRFYIQIMNGMLSAVSRLNSSFTPWKQTEGLQVHRHSHPLRDSCSDPGSANWHPTTMFSFSKQIWKKQKNNASSHTHILYIFLSVSLYRKEHELVGGQSLQVDHLMQTVLFIKYTFITTVCKWQSNTMKRANWPFRQRWTLREERELWPHTWS